MKTIFIFFAVLFCSSVSAQDLLKFEVSAGSADRIDCPVSLSIDQLNYNTDSLKLALFEVKGKTETAIPFQLETASGAKVWFILSGQTLKNTKRTFIFRKTLNPQMFKPGISVVKKDGALSLKSGDKPIFSYQIETVNPPKGVSPFYKRSAFLHPVYSPDGSMIVFGAPGNDGGLQLWVTRIHGGPLRQLTNSRGFNGQPAWSPDGGYIAYASFEERSAGSAGDLMLFDVVHETTITISSGNLPFYGCRPAWRPVCSAIEHSLE